MKRGRKSVEDLTVVTGAFGNRPEPPADLTERQAEIWRETVASEPADFFSTAVLKRLLCDYCRHSEAAEGVSAIIDTFKPEWLKVKDGPKRYKELLQIREIETRAAASMATKLRLTNQARYTPQAAGTAARNANKGVKPWEM